MRFSPFFGLGSVVLLLATLTAVPSWADTDDAEQRTRVLTPSEAVLSALELDPQVLAAQTSLDQAEGQRAQAALLLNNPQASLQVSSPGGARTNVSVSQPLSVSGQGRYTRQKADLNIQAGQAQLQRARLEAATKARQLYVDAVVSTSKRRIAEEGLKLAISLRAAVARQLEEGHASTLNLRLASLTETQAAATLLQAKQQEAALLTALSQLVGVTLMDAELGTDPLAAAPQASLQVPKVRSDVQAAAARSQAAEVEIKRARAAAIPPVSVGVFVSVEDGEQFIGPQVGMTLPTFNRNQAAKATASAQLDTQQAAVRSLNARAQTELDTALSRVEAAESLTTGLPSDPVMEAHQALSSVQAGYLAGELDLPTTILLRDQILRGEAAAVQLLGDLATARLDLLLATEDPALLGGAQ